MRLLDIVDFEKIIRLQFQSLMLLVIKRTMINHKRQISNRMKHEISTGDIEELFHIKHNDTYFYHVSKFKVFDFLIELSDDTLAKALQQLSEKQRQCILLYYFEDMVDREISELWNTSRSTVCYHRHKGLHKLRNVLKERI